MERELRHPSEEAGDRRKEKDLLKGSAKQHFNTSVRRTQASLGQKRNKQNADLWRHMQENQSRTSSWPDRDNLASLKPFGRRALSTPIALKCLVCYVESTLWLKKTNKQNTNTFLADRCVIFLSLIVFISKSRILYTMLQTVPFVLLSRSNGRSYAVKH